MGLSRRHFTREFKLAAVRRLEMGASIAEVARSRGRLRSTLISCIIGGASSRTDQAMRFPAPANGAGKKAGSPNRSVRSVSRR